MGSQDDALVDVDVGDGGGHKRRSTMTDAAAAELEATFAGRFIAHLERRKCLWLAFWSIALVVSAVFGPQLFQHTTEVFYAPKDTPSYTNNNIMASYFPHQLTQTELVLYIRSVDSASVLQPEVDTFSLAFNASCRAIAEPGFVEGVEGYYLFKHMGLPDKALAPFVSPDGKATMIVVTINALVVGKPAQAYAEALIDKIKELEPKDGKQRYTLLGAPAFMGPATQAVELDMATMDGICIPIALFILWFMLRTWRLMLLPLATVVVSALVAFAIVYAISLKARVFTVVPSLMMSLVLAISIDYSLFLLVRYRVELAEGTPHRHAVMQMTRYAGKTIAISGVVLAMCFFGLAIFPIESIKTMGLACGTVVLVVLASNETLLPVILLTFPRFFEQSVSSACYEAVARAGAVVCCCGCCRARSRKNEASSLLVKPDPDTQRARSQWYATGKRLVRWPWNAGVVVLVAAATVPFAMNAFDFSTSDNMVDDLPRGAPTTVAFEHMIDDFGYGTVFPYQLLLVPNPKQPISHKGEPAVLQDAFFLAAQRGIEQWKSEVDNGEQVEYEGLMYAHGDVINATSIIACMQPGATVIPECRLARMLYDKAVNSAQTASVVTVTPNFYLTTQIGRDWLAAMRAKLDQFEAETGIQAVLVGPGADSADTIDAVFAAFPIMISVTCGLVLVVMGVAFRSILIPLRSVVTISLSLMFTFGLANLTYEHSALTWTHIAGLVNAGTIVWFSPVCTFVIICGIGLDYDVFLTVSIVEERDKGHDTREAIARGLWRTGYIITAAGIIMAIAFSGLVLASITTLNQFGFYLVMAVLYDTFIVRSLMVPSLMGALRDANWWPGDTEGHCRTCRLPASHARGRERVPSQPEDGSDAERARGNTGDAAPATPYGS